MSLALVLGAMALAAAALLALPLLRKGSVPADRAAFDRAVFRDQLRELERDRARGVIGAEEARDARIEIERRILSTAPRPGDKAGGPSAQEASPSRHGRAFLLALAILVPAVAAGLYLELGSPQLPGEPFAGRVRADAAPNRLSKAELAKMATMLERRLAGHPQEIEGWVLLTAAYLHLGRAADADKALDRALELAAGDKARAASIAVTYGQDLIALNGGRVVPRAKSALTRALTLAPDNPAAAYYLGLAQLQAGDKAGALKAWQNLVSRAPADAPWLPGLKKRMARVARESGIDLPSLEVTPKPKP